MQVEGSLGFRGKLKGKVGAYVILASRLGVKEFSLPPVGDEDPAPPVLAFGEGTLRMEAAISPRRVRFPSFRLEVKDSVLEGDSSATCEEAFDNAYNYQVSYNNIHPQENDPNGATGFYL